MNEGTRLPGSGILDCFVILQRDYPQLICRRLRSGLGKSTQVSIFAHHNTHNH